MKIAKVTYPGVMPEAYVVTDQGCIIDTVRCRPVSYYTDKDGYYRVRLRAADGKYITTGVHRIVAWQFCDHSDREKTQVDHLNGNKTFNFARNLEWVTSGENTRRAEKMGFRCVRGSNNGNSLYEEEFIREVCEKYVKGFMPIDIYNERFPNQPIRSAEQKNFYGLLYRLKKRQAWYDVIKDYEYSTVTSRHDYSERKYRPSMHTRYTENDIRRICEMLENGYDVINVTDILSSETTGSFVGYDRERIHDIVGSIYRGSTWVHITKDYNFNAAKYSKKSLEDLAPRFKELTDAGYDRRTVARIVSEENPEYSLHYIAARYTDYLRFKDVTELPIDIRLP
jgi:hypothetical protein